MGTSDRNYSIATVENLPQSPLAAAVMAARSNSSACMHVHIQDPDLLLTNCWNLRDYLLKPAVTELECDGKTIENQDCQRLSTYRGPRESMTVRPCMGNGKYSMGIQIENDIEDIFERTAWAPRSAAREN